MDYQVILSQKAVKDLEAIVRYIALNNPEVARKLGQAAKLQFVILNS